MAASADADARNESEWNSPDNWSSHGFFYFSKLDSRWIVPKRNPWFGWTFNLGSDLGEAALIGTLVVVPMIFAAQKHGCFSKTVEWCSSTFSSGSKTA
jgi:uncharacterized membrane protein